MKLEEQLQKMQRDWDERARENARYYVNTEREDWTDDDFFRSGRAYRRRRSISRT